MVSLSIRLFTEDDIPSALALCRSAGWNQLHEDWSRLIEYQPNGCFAADLDGQLVGTVTTTSYGTALAWIGMMLVHEDFRCRGIATELMNASLDYLRDQQVGCIKLDATPAGQPVYERLGFQAECSFHRWSRDGNEKRDRPVLADTLRTSVLNMDRVAFGADRTRWLQRLADGSEVIVRSRGFGMLRSGFLADYLGPVVAEDPETARQIVVELISRSATTVFWDLPQDNPGVAALAHSLGFKPIRDLTRMWTGSNLVAPAMNLQYALSDPSTG